MREIEIKAIVVCYFTPTIMEGQTTSAGEAVEKLEPSDIADWNVKWYSCFSK